MGSGTTEPLTVDEREERFENVDREQAATRIQSFPAQIAYESKYALQLLKESELDSKNIVEIVEPLSRAIGWVEALSYATDKMTETQAVKHLIESGLFVPVSKVSNGVSDR